MSAKIRHSSLLLRKYDWIFCECINTQRLRTLHVKRFVVKHDRPLKGARRVALDQPASVEPFVYRADIDQPSSAKPLVRRLEAVLSSILSAKPDRQRKPAKPLTRTRPRGLRITKVPTTAGSAAEELRILRVGTDVSIAPKPLVRRKVSWSIDTNQGATAETPTTKRSPNSSRPTATGLFSSETGTQYRISRASTKDSELVRKQWQTIPRLKPPTETATPVKASAEEWLRDLSVRRRMSVEVAKPKPVDKQSRTVRFLKEHAEPAAPLRPSIRKQLRSLLSKPGSDKQSTILPIDSTTSDTPDPPSFIHQVRRLRNNVSSTVLAKAIHKAIEETKRQREPASHGFRKVTTEKHPLFRKIPVEQSSSVEHALQKFDFNRLDERPLVRSVERHTIRKIGVRELPISKGRLRRVKPLKIRKHLSTPLKDQPILSQEAHEMAQELDEARQEPIAATRPEASVRRVLPPVKVIKYDSFRLRKHAVTFPKFVQPLIIRTNREFKEHIEVRKVKSPSDIWEQTVQRPEEEVKFRRPIGFDDVPEGVGQPLVIKRPQNLVVQKVPSLPKEPLEPRSKARVLRAYVSSSLYPIPTEDTKILSASMPERDSIEQEQPYPANLDHWNPSERIQHAVESAAAKRLQRDSWLTRKGDVRLAISLLFSPRSLTDVERLRRMYNPSQGEMGNFKILRRLEVGKYTEYAEMLATFVESWKPFEIKLNEPAHFMEKSRYRVGLQMDFEKLEQLERTLLESVKNLPGTTTVGRRNTRDNDQLGVMVINGQIKEAEEAINLMGLLDLEHKEGLRNIRVEGLVLHGYLKGGDSLFPPPKEFRFPGAEPRIARIPAGFNQVS